MSVVADLDGIRGAADAGLRWHEEEGRAEGWKGGWCGGGAAARRSLEPGNNLRLYRSKIMDYWHDVFPE